MEKKQIVFLYTELAKYFIACVDRLAIEDHIQIHIVRWEVNKEAPFHFKFSDRVKVYDRKKYNSDESLLDLVNSISPDVIYASGWMDKGYLNVCKRYKKRIPVIVGFDNQWKGSLKQYAASLLSPFKIHPYFNYCWVPGYLQYQFAERLGFKKEQILTGFYSCDYDFFHSQYIINKEKKTKHFPKRFIYIGRYYEFKGIKDLWKAFKELKEESSNDWELWCLGTGDVIPEEIPGLKHFGFVQPESLQGIIAEAGVFVLPSHFEPWGVVVHEFAAAGFPLVCSDEVGARTVFVKNDFNGYIYKSGDVKALKEALLRFINMPDEQLVSMADKSADLAKKISPETWVKELMSVL